MILLIIAAYMISGKNKKNWEGIIDKKEHKLYFLYPLAELLLIKTGLNKSLNRKEKITVSLKALHAVQGSEFIQKLYWCSKISLVILILFIFHIFSLFAQLQNDSSSKLMDGKYLYRPKPGEGSEKVNLTVAIEPVLKESKEAGSNKYVEDISINIEEQQYAEEELLQLFDESFEYLDVSVLGANESADFIYQDLYFCEFVPGTSIKVRWEPEDLNVISRDGTLHNEGLDFRETITKVTAVLTYQENEVEFHKEVRIMPKRYSEEESLRIKLEEEIKETMNSSGEDEQVVLPGEMGGFHLFWKEQEDKTGGNILLLGFVAAVLVWIYQDQELKRRMKDRNEQMLIDYPEIINKFNLFVNAGMTIKQAWCKISQDYENKINSQKVNKRYAYEEMRITVNELKLGIPEGDAYEQFGRRVGLISYMKFGTLIAQNLRKGNKGLSELLSREAIEAFEERKEIAKRLGEEAGTKLLAPMMIMLLIVFVIILVPAFMSFQL
jgi:hypothetical protein